ncbi:NAD-dependent epimerase/dehydratase family protein [Ktedonosporobacter rubrisoli]|uniref:NAD-dependent epimerase/dehydratase family protein n=1 Tax=Ktedonosporobacter rubrisoli TaxID=2509675 RepID=A0A4P6JP53_KTERU|nr:sugar nucleotide-binding protein [Ktedonosporobacter rubrisoli]QBD77035.1 NAD-dependent epimerase/dehydratase family protein [Ktedonosporobacter rubrisoli]
MSRSKQILLLGSAGYLGRELTAQLQQTCEVIPTHRSAAHFAHSVRYDFWTDEIYPLLEQHHIDTVVIAAAMAYEAANPAYDFATLRLQATRLIQACRSCRVIYISSDGIFDGKQGKYTETDMPAPTTPYGRNLQCFEEIVQKLCADFCIIRPSYLYGYSLGNLDHRLNNLRKHLLAGDTLSYFTNMLKSPLAVMQAAPAISQLTCSPYVGIVHVAGPALSVYDFYRQAMEALHVPCQGLLPTRMLADAPYPADTSLDTSLMHKLLDIKVLSVPEALARQDSQRT